MDLFEGLPPTQTIEIVSRPKRKGRLRIVELHVFSTIVHVFSFARLRTVLCERSDATEKL